MGEKLAKEEASSAIKDYELNIFKVKGELTDGLNMAI